MTKAEVSAELTERGITHDPEATGEVLNDLLKEAKKAEKDAEKAAAEAKKAEDDSKSVLLSSKGNFRLFEVKGGFRVLNASEAPVSPVFADRNEAEKLLNDLNR